jgi:hypothetical protein
MRPDAGNGLGGKQEGGEMSSRFLVVETSLNRAEFRWKWIRFLQYSALLGTLLCLPILFFGGAILCGWVTDKSLALPFFGLVGVVGFIAWAVIAISVMAGAPNRPWLASALERVDSRLLDRLHTLLFLEKRRGEPRLDSFAIKIARQTQGILNEKRPPSPFSSTRALGYVLLFLATLTLTTLMYQLYRPWTQLLAAQKAQHQNVPSKPQELVLPATNNVEQNQAWGEVRITDPGTDLKLTKVDVVPLQIEAAANQPLRDVSWFSTINGGEETLHQLPPPAEPRYAVYQPTIYLDELHLSDWDLMTYYARASTDKTNSFGSEVYFVEVRPFREDIKQLPGGEGGKAYETLNEITGLIRRQQHVIRQTHQHVQKPPEQANLEAQDRKKLADAETDLGDSAHHLYAKMAAEMENKPIGQALDSLAKAEQSLQSAGNRLENNAMPQAQLDERTALSDLVAMRKMFQKTVSDNPGAFQQETEGDEPLPVADSFKKLSEIAEFRNQAKAAQDYIRKALEQQKSLEQQAKSAGHNDFSRLGAEEQQLQKSIEDFEEQNPQAFKGTEAESEQARQAMADAAEALQRGSRDARPATQRASRQLEKFNDAMQGRATAQQLANAYKLKQMLDQQINTFDQRAQSDSKVSDDTLQKTAREARDTVDQLAKTAEQEPTRDAFGQPLRDALSGQNKVDLEAKLRQLEQADDAATRQQRAGESRDGLARISKAFEASQPKSLQMARRADSLKSDEKDSFGEGMAELDSLIKQLQSGRQLRPEDQAKLGQQLLQNLQSGMRSQYGNNDRGEQLLLQLQEMLKPETGLDPGDLKKLMDALQHFSVETSQQLAKEDDRPELNNIDPSRLPPAYRGRIQKYFQKLSEK